MVSAVLARCDGFSLSVNCFSVAAGGHAHRRHILPALMAHFGQPGAAKDQPALWSSRPRAQRQAQSRRRRPRRSLPSLRSIRSHRDLSTSTDPQPSVVQTGICDNFSADRRVNHEPAVMNKTGNCYDVPFNYPAANTAAADQRRLGRRSSQWSTFASRSGTDNPPFLGLINDRYEVSVICFLKGDIALLNDPPCDSLWVSFDLGFVHGVMHAPPRSRRSSSEPLLFNWCGTLPIRTPSLSLECDSSKDTPTGFSLLSEQSLVNLASVLALLNRGDSDRNQRGGSVVMAVFINARNAEWLFGQLFKLGVGVISIIATDILGAYHY
ncbi:hypothetical protein LZ30DRAFT_775129 [Colletotrichum cereale]|nr:hypothetical protein LZ30DRAFT_775129 [Colletotrichum cereale]